MRFVIITVILFTIATAIVIRAHERQLAVAYGGSR